MNIDLKSLGLDEKAIIELIVNRVADRLIEGEEESSENIHTAVRKKYTEVIIEQVNQIAETSLRPKVGELMAEVKFGATNEWGEKQGPDLTLKELLAKRATAWMVEKVNSKGKSQSEDSYSWSAHQTRLAHLVHEHLHDHIGKAVKDALANFHIQLAKGLEETIKIKLNEALKGLSIQAMQAR